MATECEDCGDECKRRTVCPRCGRKVCPYCNHHVHKLEIFLVKQAEEAQGWDANGSPVS